MKRTNIALALVLGLLATRAFAEDAYSPDLPILDKHVIDMNFTSGYQVSVADINRDGKPDVIALSTSPSQLVWYRNPDWKRFTITTKTKQNIDVAPYDIDGDGDQDVALACEFDLGNSTRGGVVDWLECPADPTSDQEWQIHPIDVIPTSHRVRWADIDGNGKKELLDLPIIGVGANAPDYAVDALFTAYFIPKNPAKDQWKPLTVDRLQMAHGLRIVRWDNDMNDAVVAASFDGISLHRYDAPSKSFTKLQIGIGNQGKRPARGSSEVALGYLKKSGGQFIATIEPWHGNEVVVYRPDTENHLPWRRTVIDDSFKDGHGLAVIDCDRDGDDEIVAGYRGAPYGLYIYRHNSADQSWKKLPLDPNGTAVSGIFVADINADGRTDVVAIGSATNNVVWYENRCN